MVNIEYKHGFRYELPNFRVIVVTRNQDKYTARVIDKDTLETYYSKTFSKPKYLNKFLHKYGVNLVFDAGRE